MDSKYARIVTEGKTCLYGTEYRAVDCGPVYVIISTRGAVTQLYSLVFKKDISQGYPIFIRKCGDFNAILADDFVVAGHKRFSPPTNLYYLYDVSSGKPQLASCKVRYQAAYNGVKSGKYRFMLVEESGCDTLPSSIQNLAPIKKEKPYPNNALTSLMSQKDIGPHSLAAACGVDVTTIRSYTNGRIPLEKASTRVVYGLAKAFGCRMEDLLEKPYLEVDDSWLV